MVRLGSGRSGATMKLPGYGAPDGSRLNLSTHASDTGMGKYVHSQ